MKRGEAGGEEWVAARAEPLGGLRDIGVNFRGVRGIFEGLITTDRADLANMIFVMLVERALE